MHREARLAMYAEVIEPFKTLSVKNPLTSQGWSDPA